VRLARLIVVLLGSGLALLAAAILLSCLPASAATGPDDDGGPAAYGYTDHPSRASTPRILDLYVDRDFDNHERQRILMAVRQWNYALNGFVRFRASLLPEEVSPAMIGQIKRAGGWIVARVDSRHPIAQEGEGLHALAVTVGNNHTGFVYVLSDRIGGRDLAGVVMHEFGHVLGAGHDSAGLMAPVYSPGGARCIDHDAMAMVANAQHLPMSQLNWCEPPGWDRRPPMTSQR
jgi:Matrixin